MHDIGDAMLRTGFADPVLDCERLTVTYEELSGLMADLKGTGARNMTAGRPRGLTGRSRLRALREAYEIYRDRDGRLPATWEVIHGHAWGSQGAGARGRPDADGRVRIDLDRMR
jgi:malonyl-CoA O-methyltransferase